MPCHNVEFLKADNPTVDVSALSSMEHLKADFPIVDVEMETLSCRRFYPEAEHRMPHPEANQYKILNVREVPPLSAKDESQDSNRASEFVGDGMTDGSASKVYTDLPQDTWGSGIICIIQELPKIFTGTAGYAQFLRTGFVIFCLVLNIMLQYLILWFVLEYVTNPAVARLQVLYKSYHASCFDADGSFLNKVWQNFFYRHQLCNVTLSEPAFISTMLLIWCTRMMGEFRAVIYLVKRINGLPTVMHESLMVNLVESEGGVIHEIVGLTRPIRIVLHLLITIPKLGINAWLTWMGVRWLASTVSFPDLILNALGLQFIIEIDEMMLNSLYPERMIRSIEAAKFALPRVELSPEEDEADLKARYHESITYIIGLCVCVYCYLVYFQQVLPDFLWDINSETCATVRTTDFMPQCKAHLLPTSSRHCFPFGTNVTA
jgi:hypothetical protein